MKPVAAGDPVAGPIVEVFVPYNRGDVEVIVVGCNPGVCKHVARIEQVEALVLHGAHVEVAHRDDHVAIQVELEAKSRFVPADRLLERCHGMCSLIEVARFDPNLQ